MRGDRRVVAACGGTGERRGRADGGDVVERSRTSGPSRREADAHGAPARRSTWPASATRWLDGHAPRWRGRARGSPAPRRARCHRARRRSGSRSGHRRRRSGHRRRGAAASRLDVGQRHQRVDRGPPPVGQEHVEPAPTGQVAHDGRVDGTDRPGHHGDDVVRGRDRRARRRHGRRRSRRRGGARRRRSSRAGRGLAPVISLPVRARSRVLRPRGSSLIQPPQECRS